MNKENRFIVSMELHRDFCNGPAPASPENPARKSGYRKQKRAGARCSAARHGFVSSPFRFASSSWSIAARARRGNPRNRVVAPAVACRHQAR
ncbi:MAG: hypothetical protein ABI156_08275, partial [Caldimonas sp.]